MIERAVPLLVRGHLGTAVPEAGYPERNSVQAAEYGFTCHANLLYILGVGMRCTVENAMNLRSVGDSWQRNHRLAEIASFSLLDLNYAQTRYLFLNEHVYLHGNFLYVCVSVSLSDRLFQIVYWKKCGSEIGQDTSYAMCGNFLRTSHLMHEFVHLKVLYNLRMKFFLLLLYYRSKTDFLIEQSNSSPFAKKEKLNSRCVLIIAYKGEIASACFAI